MNRVFRIAPLSFILLITPLLFLSQKTPNERVDFSRAPAQGLKFKMTRAITVKATSTRTRGETEMEKKISADLKEVFTQTYLEVKQDKVRKLGREYEDFSGKVVMESDMMPEPREKEEDDFLAWKHVRATWDDEGEITREVKEDDAWTAADERTCKWLNARTLLHPAFPLPMKEKEMGDTWKLDSGKVIRDIIKGPSMKVDRVDFEGTVEVKLADIRKYKELRCAVLEFSVDVQSKKEDSPNIKMKGAAYYSLKHRIVVGLESEGTLKIDAAREEGEGTLKVAVTVKALEAGGGKEDG